MLKACPRCSDLVLDDSGECKKCQKRFAPDRLPSLTRFEMSRILMDRQKEKASLEDQGESSKKITWLRYPLLLMSWLMAFLAMYFLLHLVVMDYERDVKITAGVVGLTLLTGVMATVLMEKARLALPLVEDSRIAQVERAIRLLEENMPR